MILFENVSKAYQTGSTAKVVLHDATFVMEFGVSVGVLGRNGVGKSTLMRMIAGVEAPDSGEIVREVRVSWPIGFSGGFNPALSGEENARFIGKIFGDDPDYVCAFCQDFSELGAYFRQPIKTYSSGMRARLSFAVSMAIDFDVYLVDEVIAVGDRIFQKKCLDAFHERADRSMVIMVSHRSAILKQFCRRAAILADGALTQYDSVEEAVQIYGPD